MIEEMQTPNTPPKSSSFWPWALGVVTVLGLIGALKYSKQLRPLIFKTIKEGFAFKEWAMTEMEKLKEDFEDIYAEAKHEYYEDLKSSESSHDFDEDDVEEVVIVQETVKPKKNKKKKTKLQAEA